MLLLTADWRRGRDSKPCGVAPKRFSRPRRYDRFDTSPYMNCRQADFIRYSIVLEILLEMHPRLCGSCCRVTGIAASYSEGIIA